MLHFVRKLFGLSPTHAPSKGLARVAFTDEAAQPPVQDGQARQDAFIRRQAVLDRSGKIAGYEFSLRTPLQTRLQQRAGMAKRAYDAALLTQLTLHKVTSLLGKRLAFVNLALASTQGDVFATLANKNTVLVFDLLPGQPDDADALATRISELRHSGFCCGLRIQDASAANSPLIAYADFVQIDITAFNGLDLRELVRSLRAPDRAGQTSVRLMACAIPSHDDYLFCSKCGFDLFQGPFINNRQPLERRSGGINRMTLMPLLNMVRSDQHFAHIADQLKNEPLLTYRLLRYLNSPALGLQKPIDNLTEALVLIGRDTFFRWMSLLLFDFSNPDYRERLLAERALARARTLERLAGQGRVPAQSDPLFLLGLFSLLHLVLGLTQTELLDKVALPQPVRDALSGLPGPYTDALALVVLGDADANTEADEIALALERCHVAVDTYVAIAHEAADWAHQTISVAA